MNDASEAKVLAIRIPGVPAYASFTHHPIARTPNFYKPGELGDTAIANTDWVQFFEQILCGLYWKLGADVPYAFRTYDGTFRKLDAGCLKFLVNRSPEEVEFTVDVHGFIDRVRPTAQLLKRHENYRLWLVEGLTPPSHQAVY